MICDVAETGVIVRWVHTGVGTNRGDLERWVHTGVIVRGGYKQGVIVRGSRDRGNCDVAETG